MNWVPEKIVEDFILVANKAGIHIAANDITIENLAAPHIPPSKLPIGKMAVYVFSYNEKILKVGKVGSKSHARYVSQHYNPRSAPSTLAASLLKNKKMFLSESFDEGNIAVWIKKNTGRVHFIVDVEKGMSFLTLLEAFIQCRLKPVFEGFESQR